MADAPEFRGEPNEYGSARIGRDEEHRVVLVIMGDDKMTVYRIDTASAREMARAIWNQAKLADEDSVGSGGG